MSKPKLAMCNYYAMCNNTGQVIGHSDKVTKEYFELLKDDFEVELVATPSLIKLNEATGFSKLISLPYEINVDAPFTLKRRIMDKLHSMISVRKCLKSDADVIFFYQVDFFLFFYLKYFYKKNKAKHELQNKKVFALIFHQDFTGGSLEPLLQKIYMGGLKSLDGVIYTQPTAKLNHPNKIWIPDYYYEDSIYGRYQNRPKENKAVCLGSMNRFKQLEALIESFKNSGTILEICGAFDDEKRAEALKESVKAYSNIKIENRVLTKEEYYEKLAVSKYSIIPYDMKQYKNRTSGVLLESIFTGCIPVAPKELLLNNACPGIGYQDLSELKNEEAFNIDEQSFTSSSKEIIGRYCSSFVREQMVKMFLER